ncbi:ribosome maturation protein [Halteromyces radiatus]|uniref:ribosome maturation protein n=1 Tax=Halteromyces radiatus TaxID=101107 RepID=UPI0022204442|nr:ribosome maturation protein [Halteromyces radiatus]KAI8097625.1 ribosome maturation protein [Halteromyces radiatus]
MREGTCKLNYKDKNGEEFYVVAIPDMVAKWKSDKSIPLVDVVQSFDVFTSPAGGNILPADRPSKGQLETVFNTSNPDDVVRIIAEKGTVKNF